MLVDLFLRNIEGSPNVKDSFKPSLDHIITTAGTPTMI